MKRNFEHFCFLVLLPSSTFVYCLLHTTFVTRTLEIHKVEKVCSVQLLELEECPSRPAPPLLPPKPVRRETADTSQVAIVKVMVMIKSCRTVALTVER